MKSLVAALIFCLPASLQAGHFVLVQIGYAGGGPQGDHMLIPDKDGLVSLSLIGKGMGKVKADGIISEIEKSHPQLAGLVTTSVVEIDTAKLVASGKIQVSGQVKAPGEYPASSLVESVAAATPTPFGSVKRILVLRKQTRQVLDLGNNSHAATKLEPGDFVFVPMKYLIGK